MPPMNIATIVTIDFRSQYASYSLLLPEQTIIIYFSCRYLKGKRKFSFASLEKELPAAYSLYEHFLPL